MLNSILNHDGVTALDKKQQESITGGTCAVLIEGTGSITAVRYIKRGMTGQQSCDSAGSDYAQVYGGSGSYRCRYDCGFDGFDASWW